MKNRLPLLFILILFNHLVLAQPFAKTVNDAFLITTMAKKFHFHPKPLNDDFSKNVFTQLLKQLDEDKIFFTKEDIQSIEKYRFTLDDEIQNKKSVFLSAFSSICSKRLIIVDEIINDFEKIPFNFKLAETITIHEDSSYPADEKQLKVKLGKYIKATALDEILENENLYISSVSRRKKYVDSIEPILRRKVVNNIRHTIEFNFKNSRGINAAIGTEYCKAIARCYDPHTDYFPITEKENFESQLGQKPMIFGFQFTEESNGSVKISGIAPGSSAYKSGQVNKGDKIESIQWGDQAPVDVSEGGLKLLYAVLEMSNHDKASFKLKKPDGSVRRVVLYKEKAGDNDEAKVKSFLLKGNKIIGYISLPAFYQDWENENTGIKGCANDVAKEILKLKKDHIEGLILDLRYNGGGSMQEAADLAGIFIDAGPVAQFKSRESKVYTLKDMNRGSIWDGPLMVMVNGYSASASEMVAGTLQDYNRAVIIGSPTYGKATAQVILPLDTTITMNEDFSNKKVDSYIKLTVSQLYKVTGNTAQANGIQPDILLPDILDAIPQREADEPHVLISSSVDGNKYFNPNPAMELKSLQSAAKILVDSSQYFNRLKKYIDATKIINKPREISLKLEDVIQDNNKNKQLLMDSSIKNPGKPVFSVENNFYETQRIPGNDRLQNINEQWKIFLNDDPYLKLSYQLISLMK